MSTHRDKCGLRRLLQGRREKSLVETGLTEASFIGSAMIFRNNLCLYTWMSLKSKLWLTNEMRGLHCPLTNPRTESQAAGESSEPGQCDTVTATEATALRPLTES